MQYRRQQCTCVSAPGHSTQSACNAPPAILFDCQRICCITAITANLVSHIYMHSYMEDAPAMHACLHERVLCQTVVLLQAQVTDLVLQRFQSAETADLPALLRFLLQHMDSKNASQVLHLCALHDTLDYQVGPPLVHWSSCCHKP